MEEWIKEEWHEFIALDLDDNLFRVFYDFGTHVRTPSLAFTKRLREDIRRGRVRCAVRIWMRPYLKVGTKHAVDEGHVIVDAVEEISLEDITRAVARESGYRNVADLRSVIKHGKQEHLYLVRFHYVRRGATSASRLRDRS